MKKLGYFLSALLAALVAISIVSVSATFTKTYTVPTRKDRVKNEREEIGKLSYDFDALISHYNSGTACGYIPLPLTSWREVDASGDVGAIAANGGVLASDTTPILKSHTSGGTYKAATIQWAASNSDPIMIQVPLPQDFGTGYDLVLETRMGNDGNTDDVQPTVSFFVDEYVAGVDVTTDAIDATADTTFSSYDVTLTDANISDTAESLTIIITPNAHTTNTQLLSSARLNCQRN